MSREKGKLALGGRDVPLADFVEKVLQAALQPYQLRLLETIDKADRQERFMGYADPQLGRRERSRLIFTSAIRATELYGYGAYLMIVDDPLDADPK